MWRKRFSIFLIICVAPLSMSAITVPELLARLAGQIGQTSKSAVALQTKAGAQEPLTLIDIRAPALYTRSHIPGAINVPASLCAQKHLPPLGKVVVYGAGLGPDETDRAAAALASKPGLMVDILDGGFAAWESARALTTKGKGMESEAFNYITYSQVKAADPADLVLVDLRKLPSQSRPTSAEAPIARLTDLSNEFPGARLAGSALGSAAPGTRGKPPLLLLIDSGDGAALTMARILKANGTKRYAILAGGEITLARHGQAGLQRNSPGPGAFSSVANH